MWVLSMVAVLRFDVASPSPSVGSCLHAYYRPAVFEMFSCLPRVVRCGAESAAEGEARGGLGGRGSRRWRLTRGGQGRLTAPVSL